MVYKRIIPCLDIKAGRVVKGVNFKGLRDAGDPVELAAAYSQQGADELVLLDISATLEERQATREVIAAVAREVHIPFTAGGGISSVEDAHQLLLSGADKVSVNSAAVRDPALLTRLAAEFGSQCVVSAIDVVRDERGELVVTTHGGKRRTEWRLDHWLEEVEVRGAGEVLLTSMDADGTYEGYDLEALRLARQHCQLPLIASGGAGHPRDLAAAYEAGADAALAASIFHFGDYDLAAVRAYLTAAGVAIREVAS